MRKRLNIREINVSETADELAYKNIKEAKSVKGFDYWELGKKFKTPFQKYLEYTSDVDKRTDTNKYIESLNFAGGKARLQEGYGAGYDVHLYDIKLNNVELKEHSKSEYGCQEVRFVADIVPKEYDWYVDHPVWSLDSRELNWFGDIEIDVDKVHVGGKVEGYWTNPDQNYVDEKADDWSDDKIIKSIESESSDIFYSYRWGWAHHDLPEVWSIPSERDPNGLIDETDDTNRYRNIYIEKATLELDADTLNDYIHQSQDPEDYFGDIEEDDRYDEEDSQLELPFDESKKIVRESVRGNTKEFLNNVMSLLDGYMETEEEWLDMERDIVSIQEYVPYHLLNIAIKKYIEGGRFAVYHNQVKNDLSEIYSNTPEESEKWSKYPDDKAWERYVNVLSMYIPKVFKKKFGRELGELNESKIREKNSGTVEVLLYFKNPVERQKAYDFLKKKMDTYKFDDYFSDDFKGAVTKGALDKGVVVYGPYTGKIADEAKDIVNLVKEICPYEVVDSTYVRAIDESKKRVKESKNEHEIFKTKEDLWKLRKECSVGSLFTHDFDNSFGITPRSCQDFFDGYLEELSYLMVDDGVLSEADYTDAFWNHLKDYDNADNLWDYFNYVIEGPVFQFEESKKLQKKLNESKKRVKEFYTPSPNKEKFWKDPNHPQARAERDWWLHRVRTSKNNIWENDGAFDFADHDAKESLRKFGKIYVDPETGKPVEPNYVRNLIDEWGDKE